MILMVWRTVNIALTLICASNFKETAFMAVASFDVDVDAEAELILISALESALALASVSASALV